MNINIILLSVIIIVLMLLLFNYNSAEEHFKGVIKKIKVPKPPKFQLLETTTVNIDPDTGIDCDTDSLYDLKKRYKNYKKNECNYDQWVINPSRCPASKIYLKKLYQFTENAMKESVKDTDKNLKLLEERKKNNENLSLYPINNYDFDYKTAMKKKYNVFKLGITNRPTIDTLMKAPVKMKPYVSALLDKRYPDDKTIAGVSDVILDNKKALNIKKKYNELNKKLPYPSFRDDYPECRYPTKGAHSSSYFIKSGVCKTSIKSQNECERKGYKWVKNIINIPDVAKEFISFTENSDNSIPKQEDGSCYKPRFSYIDNSSKEIYGKYGLGPSMLTDINDFAPDKIFNILAGYTVDGSGLLPCIDDESSLKSETPTNHDWSPPSLENSVENSKEDPAENQIKNSLEKTIKKKWHGANCTVPNRRHHHVLL